MTEGSLVRVVVEVPLLSERRELFATVERVVDVMVVDGRPSATAVRRRDVRAEVLPSGDVTIVGVLDQEGSRRDFSAVVPLIVLVDQPDGTEVRVKHGGVVVAPKSFESSSVERGADGRTIVSRQVYDVPADAK